MTDATKEQLMRLHRSGVVMSNAWVTYAHPDLKAQWDNLKDQSAAELLIRDAQDASKIGSDLAEKFTRTISGFSALMKAQSKLRSTLQSNILSYISNGHLHGFGYELPRGVSSIPVAIPKAAWGGTCDWNKSTLSYRGLEFVDVRLTVNHIRNEVLERGNVDTTPPSPVGRPSVSRDIVAAFNALATAGEIDTTKSLKWHYSKVQRWLEMNRPHLPTPPKSISDETVRKYISPLFNELKKTKKQ